MAAITVTAANVLPGAGSGAFILPQEVAGEAITAGQSLYKKPADGKWYKADCNAAAPANHFDGIALNGAGTGQVLAVQTGGQITIGATVVVGTIYVLGAVAAGDINPVGDLTTGWFTCIIGIAITAGIIDMTSRNGGVAVP